MDIRHALKSQYHASLKTLRLMVEKCPAGMWDDQRDGLAAFWRVVYHTLFYTHMYLGADVAAFRPWEGHREDAECLGDVTREDGRMPAACGTYSPGDMLGYLRTVDRMVDGAVDALDLERAECGVPWYTMPKLEHQFVNIRHIQHHAAALSSRLRREGGVAVEWVGKG